MGVGPTTSARLFALVRAVHIAEHHASAGPSATAPGELPAGGREAQYQGAHGSRVGVEAGVDQQALHRREPETERDHSHLGIKTWLCSNVGKPHFVYTARLSIFVEEKG